MSHTPGPWIFHKSNQDTIAADGQAIALLCWKFSWREENKHEYEANARLIAAAPDLLAALEEIQKVSLTEPGVMSVRLGLIADEAIKKAKGGA